MRMQSKGRLKTLKPCGMKIILAILIKYGHGNPNVEYVIAAMRKLMREGHKEWD